MRLELRVDVSGQYFSGGAIIEIPELMRQEFEPLKTNDDELMRFIDGGAAVNSEAVKVVVRARKDAAKILAEEITKLLISEMEKNDTHNGYAKSA